MPFIELGTAAKLILSIPSKGDTNWSEEIKTSCFQKIVDHDHTTGKGVRIPAGGLAADSVITVKILDDNVTGAKIAADQIDSEHYIDGSIDLAHMSAESVDSDQYVDASIDADHLAADSVITAKILDLNVTTGKLALNAVTEAQVADSAIQVEHKKTYPLTLNGSAQSLSGLAMSADQAWKINYKLNNSAGSSVQAGTAMGQAGDFITDEFVGTDLSAAFSYSTYQLQITGTSTNVLTYSIEFLE